MPSPPDLRASDADRERTAQALRRHAADGRLDPSELDERLSVAYAARTGSELDGLTADLPELAPPAPPRAPAPRVSPALRSSLITFVSLNLVCLLVWLATGANGGFWPGWVLLGTGIALIFRVANALRGDDDPRKR